MKSLHDMMTSSNGNISALLAHSPGEFPLQRPVTRSFDVFFDLHLNKRLSKHLFSLNEYRSFVLQPSDLYEFHTTWAINNYIRSMSNHRNFKKITYKSLSLSLANEN